MASQPTNDAFVAETPPYRVIQKGPISNISVSDFASLVVHHPHENTGVRVVHGVVSGGEPGRRHAVISGEIEEVAVGVRGGTNGLAPDQILQKKDFILENPNIPSGGASVRSVDVLSPFAGYVGRAGGTMGTVDIYDREGGTLVARVLHLDPIHVTAGSTIEYGQALGVQNNKGLPKAGKHVHMEVDTRHYQAYENYVDDLVSGRLAMDPARRTQGIEPRPVVDDGVIRIGETSDRVRDVQQHLNQLGIRDATGRELPTDGVYRLSMQAAVIRFQEAQGLPPTGDIDAATLHAVPAPARREVDRPDHIDPGQPPGNLGVARPDGDGPERAQHPLHRQAEEAVRQLDQRMGRAYDATSERLAASAAALAQANGLHRIDHVVLSEATATLKPGENVFVVQGGLSEATNRVAYMKTQDAIRTPVEQWLERFATTAPEHGSQIQQHAVETQPRQPAAHGMTI